MQYERWQHDRRGDGINALYLGNLEKEWARRGICSRCHRDIDDNLAQQMLELEGRAQNAEDKRACARLEPLGRWAIWEHGRIRAPSVTAVGHASSMSSAELVAAAALGASAITAAASLGITWYREHLRGKAAHRDTLAAAVTEMLSRSMAVMTRAQALSQ